MHDFQICKLLGKGASSKVHLAQHYDTKMLVALKEISKAYINELKMEEMITREIKLQSFVHHRNLAKLYGYFSD